MYVMLIIILDMSESNIISLINNHKSCNYKYYETSVKSFASKLFVTINSGGDIKPLSELGVLGYLITLFSCLYYEYNLFFDNKKNKPLAIKTMIVTFVDLLNTILYINSYPIPTGKSYLFQVVAYRFFQKIGSIFSNNTLLLRIKAIQDDEKSSTYQSIKTKKESQKFKLNDEFAFNYYFIPSLIGNNLKLRHINFISRNKVSQKSLNFESSLTKNYKKNHNKTNNNLFHKLIINNDISVKAYDVNDKSVESLMNNLCETTKKSNITNDIALINHTYQGFKREKSLKLNWSELKYIPYDSQFKQPIYYYVDKEKNVKVFYNYKYLNLLGYKESNGRCTEYKGTSLYIKKELNFTNIIQNLGHTKVRYNIKNDLIKQIQSLFPYLTYSDIESHIMNIVKLKEINNQLLHNNIQIILNKINNERLQNIKSIMGFIRTYISRLSKKFSSSINENIVLKPLTLEDEYNPVLVSRKLLEDYVKKMKVFNLKCDNILESIDFLEFSDSVKFNIDNQKVELIFERDILSESKVSKNMINILCNQMNNFLIQNTKGNENVKMYLCDFIYEIIRDQYESYNTDYNTFNTFFDKQLNGFNYKSAYDKKLTEEIISEGRVLEEADDSGELDPVLDEDLDALINDIDQEENPLDRDGDNDN